MNQSKSDEEIFSNEDSFFEIIDTFENDRIFVLIIYDIIDNKRRLKFAKFLLSYGFRVQKSAFEALIPKNKYQQLIEKIPSFAAAEDSIRLYKMIGKGQVMTWGESVSSDLEEIVII